MAPMRRLLGLMVVIAGVMSLPGAYAAPGSAVHFYGTGAGDTDRIKLRVDNPANSADVGSGDFTIEFWLNAELADNASGSCDDWICGNIIFDRDIFGGNARDYGISMRNGLIYFGTGGATEHVLRGDQDVADGGWHHIALTRVRSSGLKCLYIDGALDVPCENGTTEDISYPDGYIGSWPNDPFLVVGAEKHDVNSVEYPSFAGALDEIRMWGNARTQAQIAANKNLSLSGTEAGLVVYWRLDEGVGTVAGDSSGDGNHGEVKTGSPGAAEWVASTAPIGGGSDFDGDSVPDATDNCPAVANASQTNNDANFVSNAPVYGTNDLTWANSDGFGDACDDDDDNDGLTDAAEAAGCNGSGALAASLRDTDGDRYLDGPECALGSNPGSDSSVPAIASCGTTADSDGDGLTNRVEACFYNSSTGDPNTDRDLCDDGREAASLNGDSSVNSGDQLLLAQEIIRTAPPPKLLNFDMNKDGGVNSGDQLVQAGRIGACLAGSWQALAPLPGGPRQETGVAALGGEIYVVGGFNGSGTVVATVEAYNPGANTWRSVAPVPVAMHHANVAVVGGSLYVTGFLTGGGFVANGAVYRYDPGPDDWTPETGMPPGTQRGASGVAVVGSTIYITGGYRGGTAVADFSAYDTTTDTWTTLVAVPTSRDHLTAGAIDGKVYVGGGRNGTIPGHFPRLDVYDPLAGTWTLLAPMPTSRGGVAGAVVDGRLIIIGGEGSGTGSGVFSQVEAYAPATGHWSTMTAMVTPRHGTGAAEVGGIIYVPGGATTQGFGAVATNESFDPPP
jgi:N-acetylneuraminic acid mutarotase